MSHSFIRTELLIGRDGLHVLQNSTVAVLGIGGVGAYTVEALVRSGVGRIILLDHDRIDITNVNRQIHAFPDTVDQLKTELMKERITRINPDCEVIILDIFYNEETYEQLFQAVDQIDYIADAIDTISSKIHVVKQALERKIPLISSMGAANKTDPTRFQVADLFQTSYDPIAKVMRRELRQAGISKGVKVVYSTEVPAKQKEEVLQQIEYNEDMATRKERLPPGTTSFMPPVAGLILAGAIIDDLLAKAQITIERKDDE